MATLLPKRPTIGGEAGPEVAPGAPPPKKKIRLDNGVNEYQAKVAEYEPGKDAHACVCALMVSTRACLLTLSSSCMLG